MTVDDAIRAVIADKHATLLLRNDVGPRALEDGGVVRRFRDELVAPVLDKLTAAGWVIQPGPTGGVDEDERPAPETVEQP